MALTEIADRFDDWRYRHPRAVARTMDAKAGGGNSSRQVWPRRGMTRVVFAELWSARTAM